MADVSKHVLEVSRVALAGAVVFPVAAALCEPAPLHLVSPKQFEDEPEGDDEDEIQERHDDSRVDRAEHSRESHPHGFQGLQKFRRNEREED